ncbi:hypothetical protein Nepgr_009507 [Nepenthes gracilis]|uniref:Uncharacterized protein n=1 Tax=Nepenthes gracilis TaxID=150966 RepID=A0AAD3SBK8_NEPGR|nr:hypothetical protein Nepgr_009507 [Nepenthes gracilis]
MALDEHEFNVVGDGADNTQETSVLAIEKEMDVLEFAGIIEADGAERTSEFIEPPRWMALGKSWSLWRFRKLQVHLLEYCLGRLLKTLLLSRMSAH